MSKIVIELTQHTPLIHFQTSQEGATLRASDVKPKLDKHLLTTLGELHPDNNNLDKYQNGIEYAHEQKWLIGNGEHPALNYKLSFEVINDKLRIEDIETINPANNKLIAFPCFFANMGIEEGQEKHKFSYAPDGIKMIMYFPERVSGLQKWIEEDKEGQNKISNFFFNYNFGMRSSKGFGSFYPVIGSEYHKNLRSSYYFFSSKKEKGTLADKFKPLFTDINLFYNSLRTGVRDREGEFIFEDESLLHMYCTERLNKEWDRPLVQNSLTGENVNTHNHIDIKDVLGFSTTENWKSYNRTIIRKNEGAERMQSPIMFKPILRKDNSLNIFILLFSRTGLKEFLETGRVNYKILEEEKETFDLALPQFGNAPDGFKVSNFFRFIFDEGGYKSFFEGGDDNNDYTRLKTIYEEIDNNRKKHRL